MSTVDQVKEKLKEKANASTNANQVQATGANSTSVSTEEKKPKTILDVIEDRKGDLAQLLPAHFPIDKFVRLAITTIRSNEKLRACTPASLMGALVQAAQLGLEVNSPLHQAAIVPFKNKRKENGQWKESYEATFMMEYRGLAQLIWQSGLIKALDFDMVCDNDLEFTYEKTQDGIKFSHKPLLRGKRENPYAYYAWAQMTSGGFTVVVMSKESIEEHAKTYSKSKDYNSGELTGMWKDDFDAMALKTVLKQLADKRLPKSVDREVQAFNRAIAADESIKTQLSADMTELNNERDPEGSGPIDAEYTEVNTEQPGATQ